VSVDPGHAPGDEALGPDAAIALPVSRSNGVWIIVALIAIGFAVSLTGLVLVLSIVRQAASTPDTVALGQVAVLAIVGGGGAICVGVGCLLFGWAGGSPYVAVGSHRSILATTTLAVVLGALLGVGYLRVAGRTGGDPGEILGVLGATVYGMFLVMVYVQGVRTGLVTRVSLGIAPGMLGRALLGGVAAAAVIVAFAAVNGLVLDLLGIKQPQADTFAWLQGKSLSQYNVGDVLAVLTVVVVAPTVEELFFRAYVFNAYLRTKGPTTAYVGSALIFSLIHGYPALIIAIFVMGLILAYTYRRTGTILAPISAHIMNNALAFVALAATGAQH
jgi:membrane protease YdiL (CAAX protease family)